jgi:hypothetical protein
VLAFAEFLVRDARDSNYLSVVPVLDEHDYLELFVLPITMRLYPYDTVEGSLLRFAENSHFANHCGVVQRAPRILSSANRSRQVIFRDREDEAYPWPRRQPGRDV